MAVVASEIEIRLAVVRKFPGLAQSPFEITSPVTPVYNCIAWAAGDDRNFWWPSDTWPRGLGKSVTRPNFVRAFELLGYSICDIPDPEDGFEKIALYEDAGGPTHAARLLPNGRWTSKLGRSVDISHSLEALNGEEYGAPTLFMRRPTPGPGEAPRVTLRGAAAGI